MLFYFEAYHLVSFQQIGEKNLYAILLLIVHREMAILFSVHP